MPSNFAEHYEAVINWEKRLARERPLLVELARSAGRRVLIPACGTGAHVVALARDGFSVLGFDADEEMVALARQRIDREAKAIFAAGGEATASVLRMEEAGELGPTHDVACCLGNALPGISGEGQLAAALKGVAGALRAGGLFFTQNLNYDLRWKEKAHWFPVLSGETGKEEVLLVKFADYEPQAINFHAMFLTRQKAGGKWQSEVRSSRQIPLFRDRLAELLTEAGFGNLQYWGDYAKAPFDPANSNDLLVVGEKLD
ncbi:putative methyltransferase [Acidobacteriia bacterium SbA2]|nr:putative methyltransferase [Acidobacteriia bacterium SbA2]